MSQHSARDRDDRAWGEHRGAARHLPRIAALVALSLAGIDMAVRGRWPSGEEALLLGITVVCLYGVLCGVLPSVRIGAALLWIVAVVVVSGSLGSSLVGAIDIWGDFQTFVKGAELLFGDHRSPYLNFGTTAFPFPTLSLVRALSLNGRLSFESTLGSFVLLQIFLLALSYLCVRAILVQEGWQLRFDLPMALIQGGLLCHPAVIFCLFHGQSSILAGSFLAAAVWCWRCHSHRVSRHAAAALLNLAWMTKPQLLMAVAYFVACWLLSGRQGGAPRGSDGSAAAIGRLVGPWCVALIMLSLALDFHGHVAAYREFPWVALRWHTAIAVEKIHINYAIGAILAKALARYGGFPVLEMLEMLTLLGAGVVLAWNLVSMRAGPRGALLTFLPWLVASLLWTSLVWALYLSQILAGILLLVASERGISPVVRRWRALWVAGGVGLTMVFSGIAFTVGILLVYCFAHEVLAGHQVSDQGASCSPEGSLVKSAYGLEAGRAMPA